MKNIYFNIKWMSGQSRPFISSLIKIVIMGSIIPLCGIGMAIASKILIDSASTGFWKEAVYAAISFAALILLQVALHSILPLKSTHTLELLSNHIRKKLVNHLSESRWLELSKYHTGDIMTRLTSDIGAVANGIVIVLPGIFSLTIQFVVAFITLMLFEPILAIVAFVLAPTAILFSHFLGTRIKSLHINIQESESKYRSFLHELLQNMSLIKAFCIEKEYVDKVEKRQNQRLIWVLRRIRIQTAAGSIISLSYWISYFIAFCWGAVNLSKGTATFGTLAAFLQLVEQIQTPFFELTHKLPQFVSSLASADRLRELEKLQPDNNCNKMSAWSNAGILIEKADFAYEQHKPILKDVSLKVNPGDIIGIEGTSGGGKTTLIRLLLAFIYPDKGNIYFFDETGKQLEASSASRVLFSYVPQGNTMFSGTIADNLRIGDPNATLSELEAAAHTASALEFIKALPDGFDTMIGERGLGLSEGQIQRLAIARAILHKAPILILDEATSQLDVHTEVNVLKRIRNLIPPRTCIIISHRLDALEICNRRFVLKNGYIRECQNSFTSNQAIAAD